MPHDLEFPNGGWESLYRARADDVPLYRPIFTGDSFLKAEVHAVGGTVVKDVIVLQHPCSLRTNGMDPHSRLLVAELRRHKIIPTRDWAGHIAKMPLPDLLVSVTSGRRHQAAFFDELYFAAPNQLMPEKRVACMSQVGVNLLLQRWVFHNSRVAIPTWRYQQVSSPQFEEADLTEEWCEERLETDLSVRDATVEALTWLRETNADGVMRQELLEDPQSRSAVRKEMREALRKLREV